MPPPPLKNKLQESEEVIMATRIRIGTTLLLAPYPCFVRGRQKAEEGKYGEEKRRSLCSV